MNMRDLLGSNPTTEAMKQQGVNPSVLFPQNPLEQQTTPMSASFDPNMEAGAPFPTPSGSPMSAMAPMQQPQAPQQLPQNPPPNPNPNTVPMGGGDPSLMTNPAQKSPEALKSEAELIVQALMKRLAHHTDMEKSTLPQNDMI